MKLLKPFLICFVIVFAFGCEENTSSKKNINHSKIENVKILKNEAQRLSFGMLNDAEREFIWDQHFEEVLSQNSLTDAQVELILELKKLNTESLHSGKSSENSRKQFEMEWLVRAEKSFNKSQLRNLAYSLNPKLTTEAEAETKNSAAREELKNCSCNTTSMFTCGELATCEGACLTTTIGCGFMWLWDCNGRCTLTRVD